MTTAADIVLELRQQAATETRPEVAALLIRAAVRIGLDAATIAARDLMIGFHRERADLLTRDRALNDGNPANFYRARP